MEKLGISILTLLSSFLFFCQTFAGLNEELWKASERGDLKLVKELVSKGADVNAKDANGGSPLFYAARNKHLKVVKYLLSKGADANSKDKFGRTVFDELYYQFDVIEYLLPFIEKVDQKSLDRKLLNAVHFCRVSLVKKLLSKGANANTHLEPFSPLHHAVISSCSPSKTIKIISLLLSKGADVNAKDIEKISVLHYATDKGLEVVKYLVSKGANVNAKDVYGRTPLHFASDVYVKTSSLEVVKYLVSKGANVDVKSENGETPLSLAIHSKKWQVVDYLLPFSKDKDLDILNEIDVFRAAEKGCLNIVKLFVSKGTDINAKDSKFGATPLHWAAFGGQLQVVKYLLSHGANLNAKNNDGETPFEVALRANKLNIANYFLSLGKVEKDSLNRGLIKAAEKGDLRFVKKLLLKGADVNAKDKFGWTPLHHAVEQLHFQVVKYLVSHGANVNAETDVGRTPLHVAACRKSGLKVVKYLISKGADVNAKESNGVTPLYYAAEWGYLDIVKYLVSKGARVNAEDNGGYTPLHMAAINGHIDVYNYLISKGANPNIVAQDGKSPRDYLREKQRESQCMVTETRNNICDSLYSLCDSYCEYKSKEGSGFFSSSDWENCRSDCYYARKACKRGEMSLARVAACRGICRGVNDKLPLFSTPFSETDYDKCVRRCQMELENKGFK